MNGSVIGITVNKFRVDKKKENERIEERATILANIPSRWPLEPGYMHSFAMTDRYFVLIEQPLGMGVPAMVKGLLRNRPLIESMRWRGNKGSIFHVIDRMTGELVDERIVYKAEAFFFLHTINAYEENGHLVVDISCYESPSMLHCMNLEALQMAQSDPNFARKFRGRPRRYVLPLKNAASFSYKHSKADEPSSNLVALTYTTASAYAVKKSKNKTVVSLEPQEICDFGCETPTIFYDK